MTVAALIGTPRAGEASRDASGRSAVRRIVEAAWAGGALPIVVSAPEPADWLESQLSGFPALIARDGPDQADEAEAYRAACRVAIEAVGETDAVLLWPMRMSWVDPETVTSLIEAHGQRPGQLIRVAHEELPGWPLLVPISDLERGLAASAGLADPSGVVLLELGDPGSVLDSDTPQDRLPPYRGPAAPVAGPPPDWGAAAADEPDQPNGS
jgi:hypothetical protein